MSESLDTYVTRGKITVASFVVPMPDMLPIPVVSLFVEGKLYRLASSCCCPNKDFVMMWAAAWARCRAYIEAVGLEPGWPARLSDGGVP